MFEFLPISLCLFTGHHWENSGSTCFTPPIRYLYTLTWSPEPSLLWPEQSPLSQPPLIRQMLQALSHLCGSLLNLLQWVHVSLVLGSPALGTGLQACLTRTEQGERSHPLSCWQHYAWCRLSSCCSHYGHIPWLQTLMLGCYMRLRHQHLGLGVYQMT